MSIEEIIKMAHNYGCLYESTLNEEYSEETLLKDLKKQLTLTDLRQQRELLRFMEWLSTYWGIDEVIDCTKHQNIVEQYKP